jgi:hypothetical protein
MAYRATLRRGAHFAPKPQQRAICPHKSVAIRRLYGARKAALVRLPPRFGNFRKNVVAGAAYYASSQLEVLHPASADREITQLAVEHGDSDVAHLSRELGQGAGLAIVAEEALATADLRVLEGWMRAQPPWSDLPIVLLTRQEDTPARNPNAQRLQDIWVM